MAGCLMLIRSFKNAKRSIKQKISNPQVLAGPLIIVSWILMLLINWAQLNQSFPWVFLALVIMQPRWILLQRKRPFLVMA